MNEEEFYIDVVNHLERIDIALESDKIDKKIVKEIIDKQTVLSSTYDEDTGAKVDLEEKWIDRDNLKKELGL